MKLGPYSKCPSNGHGYMHGSKKLQVAPFLVSFSLWLFNWWSVKVWMGTFIVLRMNRCIIIKWEVRINGFRNCGIILHFPNFPSLVVTFCPICPVVSLIMLNKHLTSLVLLAFGWQLLLIHPHLRCSQPSMFEVTVISVSLENRSTSFRFLQGKFIKFTAYYLMHTCSPPRGWSHSIPCTMTSDLTRWNLRTHN